MAEDILALEQFLPYRLNRLAEAVSRDFSKLYKDRYGLTRPEWRVLATLGQYGRMTATAVGRHSAMHKTKVSRAVAALEKRKWLARAADEDDRRVEWLELTRTGRSRFAHLSGLAGDFEARLREALGAEAIAGLERALAVIETVSLPAMKSRAHARTR